MPPSSMSPLYEGGNPKPYPKQTYKQNPTPTNLHHEQLTLSNIHLQSYSINSNPYLQTYKQNPTPTKNTTNKPHLQTYTTNK